MTSRLDLPTNCTESADQTSFQPRPVKTRLDTRWRQWLELRSWCYHVQYFKENYLHFPNALPNVISPSWFEPPMSGNIQPLLYWTWLQTSTKRVFQTWELPEHLSWRQRHLRTRCKSGSASPAPGTKFIFRLFTGHDQSLGTANVVFVLSATAA